MDSSCTSVNSPLADLYASTDFYLENLQYLLKEIKLALGQVAYFFIIAYTVYFTSLKLYFQMFIFSIHFVLH